MSDWAGINADIGVPQAGMFDGTILGALFNNPGGLSMDNITSLAGAVNTFGKILAPGNPQSQVADNLINQQRTGSFLEKLLAKQQEKEAKALPKAGEASKTTQTKDAPQFRSMQDILKTPLTSLSDQDALALGSFINFTPGILPKGTF